jgi:GNAT superfamily N-acetyltransferase
LSLTPGASAFFGTGPALVQLIAADSLELPVLVALFNEGFSDYLVPMQLDEAAFRAHVERNDIDLACSRVAADEEPVAFVLVGVRDGEAWIGGMGTVPGERRRGLGERALLAAIDAATARGAANVWLEVITGNEAALTLYRKLGFELVRDLTVWSLPGTREPPPASRQVEVGEARAWIAAHRASREPWQRSDAALLHMDELRALMIDEAAAVIYRLDGEAVSMLQIAATDEEAAAAALRAAAGEERDLRLSNAPAGEVASRALERLGARAVVTQHELVLRGRGH